MRTALLVCSLLCVATACRGERVLLCEDLTAWLDEDAAITVLWEACADDIVREIRCEPADPRYRCDCYEDSALTHSGSLSDDIEQALLSGDRDAIRASSNATCAFGLEAIEP